ncbi:MAG: Asp-tRNA(Asn)/Glu-tRNA(Gln) amidotransferase subunit GatB [Candidatus Firestonebacteria bacterium]
MNYETVIGLEIHTQLKTATKIFCGCSNKFGGVPNTFTCPVCLGLPGALPVFNKAVLNLALRVGISLGCEISPFSKFDRKNYFYPDLPKNFQISQYDMPLCYKGHINLNVNKVPKTIRITRVHLEEDAGKLVHMSATGQIGEAQESLVDLNRTGVPLLEIVSEPDMNTPEEAYEYLIALKDILKYIDVSDCNMEEGSLRCDANISIRQVGEKKLGVKAEVKNLNSFKNVRDALEYEAKRQIEVLNDGGKIIQETRLWDDKKGITFSMRSKEEAQDYRYFPEPDLVSIVVTNEWLAEIKKEIPELPIARKNRFISSYGLPEYDAEVLTSSRDLANYYEECVKLHNDPKLVSNWIMVELLGLLKSKNMEITDCKVSPLHLSELFNLIKEGTISGKIAKTVFEEMFSSLKKPLDIVKEKGLVQISDEKMILEVIDKVLLENTKSVDEYLAGKEKAIGYLVGQVMRHTSGKANPQLVNKLLKEKLNTKK